VLMLVVCVVIGATTSLLAIAPQEPVTAETPTSVVVLVFTNITGEAADEWMGAGIAETVATRLDGVEGLRVVRSGPSTTGSPSAIAQALEAPWVISGAYQRLGGRMRITARITNIEATGVGLSAIVDGSVDEFFVLQDRLITQIREALVSGSDRGMPTRVTRDPDSGIEDSLTGVAITTDTSQENQPSLILTNESTGTDNLLPSERYRVEPAQVDQGPQVDGYLDEEVWQGAAIIDEFIQQEPSEGDPATERTVVRLLYDAANLYIGVEAYDSQPSGIIATEMRRDSLRILDEDNFQVILDTFQDRRSGYMFVTSPLGAKLEQQVTEEGEGGWRGANTSNINLNWDGVWDVATTRTPDGWVAEIAIPMVTLRFPKTDRQVWGVNFMRNIRQKNEQVFWAPITKEYQLTRVSLAGTMEGISGVTRGMDLRVTPYVLSGGKQQRNGPTLDASGFGDVGLDVKYGIASGLNLDLTLNTDFAQVEVDEQQVNLTRFPLFFPEKRDFFLENSGMFNVGAGSSGFGRQGDLFFTRRIGLSSAGQPVPIIGGARLTGKVDRHNIAVLNITTQEGFGALGENVFVGRYSRDIFARSKIGGIVINKQAVGGGDYNRTFAVDTSLAVHRNFVMNGYLAKTQTPGISTGDMAGYFRGTWLSPSSHFYGEYTDLQDNFNAEVGFVPRVGIRTSKFHAEWNPRPGKWNIRMLDPMWNMTYTTDQHNRLLTRRIHHMVGVYFEDGSSGWVFYNDHFEQLNAPFYIHKDVTIPAGTYRFGEWVYTYKTDPSRRLYGELTYKPQTFFGGTRTDLRGTVGLRATSRIAMEAKVTRSNVDLPGGAFIADLASLTADFALSPELTLRTLSQYNSVTHEISNSIRFNWIYKPGSDIYIAYDELRLDMGPQFAGIRRTSPWVRNRQLAIKMTYLVTR
jgi:TolB-like protein